MNKNNYRFRFLIQLSVSSFLYLLLFLSSKVTFGQNLPVQSKKWNIYNYANDAGLQRTNIFQVDFDSANSVWIASSDGLFRYDGYTFQKFTTENGLPSNFVRTIKVVDKNAVWIGTDNGPAFYNGDEIVAYTNNLPDRNRNIRRIFKDAQNTIWFCADSWPMKNTIGGLAYFKNNQFFEDTFFGNKYVVTIFQSHDETYYVITDDGIYSRNTNNWVKLNNRVPENDEINWTQ